MPTPRDGETESAFISRCMSQLDDEGDQGTQKQKLGKCYGLWRQGGKAGGKDGKPKTALKDVS